MVPDGRFFSALKPVVTLTDRPQPALLTRIACRLPLAGALLWVLVAGEMRRVALAGLRTGSIGLLVLRGFARLRWPE